MTASEIFDEVIKSPELIETFNIPKDQLELEHYDSISKYPVIEIIKAIIRGEDNHTDKGAIFKIIQNQIMQL